MPLAAATLATTPAVPNPALERTPHAGNAASLCHVSRPHESSLSLHPLGAPETHWSRYRLFSRVLPSPATIAGFFPSFAPAERRLAGSTRHSPGQRTRPSTFAFVSALPFRPLVASSGRSAPYAPAALGVTLPAPNPALERTLSGGTLVFAFHALTRQKASLSLHPLGAAHFSACSACHAEGPFASRPSQAFSGLTAPTTRSPAGSALIPPAG